MAKTFENFECTFFTGNTTNSKGDSRYIVLESGMSRTALVNFKRAPSQVLTGNPSICYLEDDGELNKIIMKTPKDRDITIAGVEGDRIIVSVNRAGQKPFVGEASRKPANGLVTFDFVNNDGMLSHIHVGHGVKLLSLGRPESATTDTADDIKAQYAMVGGGRRGSF